MKVRGSYLTDEIDLKFFCLHGSHYGDLRFTSNCQNLVHVSTLAAFVSTKLRLSCAPVNRATNCKNETHVDMHTLNVIRTRDSRLQPV